MNFPIFDILKCFILWLRDVTLWLSGTTVNSNFFIGSSEVRDNER